MLWNLSLNFEQTFVLIALSPPSPQKQCEPIFFFKYYLEIYTTQIEALSELITEFSEKSSLMALKVNKTDSIHFFCPTAAIKPYQKDA